MVRGGASRRGGREPFSACSPPVTLAKGNRGQKVLSESCRELRGHGPVTRPVTWAGLTSLRMVSLYVEMGGTQLALVGMLEVTVWQSRARPFRKRQVLALGVH